MIGFGPTIWSRRRGETEYGIKLLPLGGYIAMAGMYPPKVDGEPMRDATTSFFDAAVQEGPAERGPEARVLPPADLEAHRHHARRAVH